MTVYGYARVSSQDQNLDRQREALADVDILREEKMSGRSVENRPVWQNLLEFVQAGDTIRVKSPDRLARNTVDLLSIAQDLSDKGVSLEFVDSPEMNVSTAQGEFMLTIMAAFAQFERDISKARQREGIAAAKERGVYSKPRPKARALTEQQIAEAQERRDAGESVADLAKAYGVSRQTMYNVTHS
ncbi:recombinase family protein [Brevibacterium permense]|uniref:recombinase family protein n=1 Tax=Brevibacterium permense TaxID=234834 RepID=UPI0021D10366|nr:recombinase family protein [Brevibacterium permense]MCU4298889.1 recombinase family protein [Brevibacterium permense]